MTARFNTAWMSKEEYKCWLQPVPSDNTRAKCTLCMKTISLPNMGEAMPQGRNIRQHVN